jgi:hypothetical protein
LKPDVIVVLRIVEEAEEDVSLAWKGDIEEN